MSAGLCCKFIPSGIHIPGGPQHYPGPPPYNPYQPHPIRVSYGQTPQQIYQIPAEAGSITTESSPVDMPGGLSRIIASYPGLLLNLKQAIFLFNESLIKWIGKIGTFAFLNETEDDANIELIIGYEM
jgi:hypothetical protein